MVGGGGTDESRKCSHGNANECAPPLPRGPQRAHTTIFFLFLSIQLITSLHLPIHPSIHPPLRPSTHPSIYLWRCRAKSFLICQSSSKRLSGGRFGKKDDDSLRMRRFHCSVLVLIPALFPLLTEMLCGAEEKWRCADFFFFWFPLYHVATGAAPACFNVAHTHTHTQTLTLLH